MSKTISLATRRPLLLYYCNFFFSRTNNWDTRWCQLQSPQCDTIDTQVVPVSVSHMKIATDDGWHKYQTAVWKNWSIRIKYLREPGNNLEEYQWTNIYQCFVCTYFIEECLVKWSSFSAEKQQQCRPAVRKHIQLAAITGNALVCRMMLVPNKATDSIIPFRNSPTDHCPYQWTANTNKVLLN